MHELLTVAQMGRADRLTIESGISGIRLMEAAGQAVFAAAMEMTGGCGRVLVACGGGNNGGDGLIAARKLAAHGVSVTVAMHGGADRLTGDAATAHARRGGTVSPLGQADPAMHDLIIDALFGAGLDRDIEGEPAAFIARCNEAGRPVLAVDLPSGIHGDTGAVMGGAVRAARTVTFFRGKPGHVLMPGLAHCGPVTVAQIGIGAAVLETTGFAALRNHVDNWRAALQPPQRDQHKYQRGHALVFSGPQSRTGAARLGAHAALRTGAGLVTLAAPRDAIAVNAAHLREVMLADAADTRPLGRFVAERKITAMLAGPALGTGEETRRLTREILAGDCSAVLDADALTAHEGQAESLFGAIGECSGEVVLTPHAGEFSRLFGAFVTAGSKLDQAREAARISGACVLLKGPDTVIAAPDGRAAIHAEGPAWLATAGSGDVLAGIVCGLLAQGVPAFEAACAGAWLHSRAAARMGPGMIAGDITDALSAALGELHQI